MTEGAAGRQLKRLRALAAALPGAEESRSYGTPAFRVRSKLFARMHQDGESLVLRCEPDEREVLLAASPEVFFVTDHYREHPFVLARLDSISPEQLAEVFEHAWRLRAPRRLVDAFDNERGA